MLLSVHLLGKREGALAFDRWRRRTRPRLDPVMQPLFALAPPWGYSADFLTPPDAGGGLQVAIETVLSTPKQQLRQNADQLPVRRPSKGFVSAIRLGDPEALRELGTALSRYHRESVEPYWDTIDAGVQAERARLARAFLDGGTEGVLAALRPLAVWEPPVLSLPRHPADRDIYLDGGGLILQPAFFCWRAPTTLRSPDGPQVLVYPIEHDLTWLTRDVTSAVRPLAALIGPTRAVVMTVVAELPVSTTELARRAHISAASASEHARVLRDAGLLASHRDRHRVCHSLTPLGARLLQSTR
ncbi:ArsR/SmtB family transcription factor [Actinomadura opuntiae]|uniref:ArsR/SmtB family transcription factor n=1 Tax=Actinomadura sp. OS1-43 TaxID=604315 RepID=UPI00255AFCFF|nr:winged helix-turn-helix domain-containing protein [Actinomadura sp. OS1-43]MDL4816554.1 winged helix-turn-helix domain-containing protein [Actinomadura sp. OS1-43]